MSHRSESSASSDERRAIELLRGAGRLLLTGHLHPDGDCVGAQAALAEVLTSLGKEVWIVNPDPIDPEFDYLANQVSFGVYRGGDLPRHDVSVLLDCSELKRCGDVAQAITRHGSPKLVIDHHPNHDEAWWDAALVDVTASATGVLVYRLARELGVPLSRTAANGVFTSIVTDTGWFKYSNTDAETLRIAGELVELGVDPDSMYRAIYQRKRRAHPIDTGRILSALEYHADDRLAVACLPSTAADGVAAPDGDDAMDVMRSVASVEVVLFLRELAGGEVKLSARSKSDYDVNALARQFGGGGHRKASGATIAGSLDHVRARLLEAALPGFENGPGFEDGAGFKEDGGGEG